MSKRSMYMTSGMKLYATKQGIEFAEKLLRNMHSDVIQLTMLPLARLIELAILHGMCAVELHSTKAEPHADMYEWRY